MEIDGTNLLGEGKYPRKFDLLRGEIPRIFALYA